MSAQNHETLASDPELLMTRGIKDVQEALAHPLLRNVHKPIQPEGHGQLAVGINALILLESELGVRGVARSVANIAKNEPYPRTLIVETTLSYVGISPVLDLDAKRSLTDAWIQAASTGTGRIYPATFIARHSAAQILDTCARVSRKDELDLIVRDIEKDFFMTKMFQNLAKIKISARGK